MITLFTLFSLCNRASILINSADSSHQKDSIQARKHSVKPAFDFDQRFSLLGPEFVNIWGARAGLLVNDKFKIGFGLYFLGEFNKNKKVPLDITTPTYAKRNLYFGTLYFEPFIFKRKYWELSLPIEAGFGKSIFRTFDSNTNVNTKNESTFFIPSGGGLSLSLKLPAILGWRPSRWIGINFLAGYRYDFKEKYFGTNFDGAFWSVSGAIFLDRIADDIHYWRSVKKFKRSIPE